MTSRRILVPLDGSAVSNAALPLARALAQATGASITLMRVVPRSAPDDSEAHSFARARLEKIAHELAGSGLRVDALVRRGHAAAEILDETRTQPCEMVVMRTHGRAGLERAILGSVTQQVLEECQVPVVLMRPGERRITTIHKLLVPVDGSPGGAVALGTADRLARSTGATIKLLEVVVPIPMQTLAAYEYAGLSYYDPAWDDETLTSAKTYVDALVMRLRDTGLAAEGEAFMAPAVANAIVNAVDKEGVDLVVMSTRALTGPTRALLGSVADAVVRTAHCPVLLVHRFPPTEDGADPHPNASDAEPAAVSV